MVPRVLVFSKTTGYRHESIPAGVAAMHEIGSGLGLGVDATEDSAVFTADELSGYAAVVFLNATGPLLDAAGRDALAGFVTAGGGLLAVHGGIIAEPDWPFFRELMAAEFTGHPQVQPAVVHAVYADHPATVDVPVTWLRVDEWYNFAAHPGGPGLTVLLTVDEASYEGGTMGEAHPLAWCHARQGGRVLVTALGHTIESYTEPELRAHLAGALRYVAALA